MICKCKWCYDCSKLWLWILHFYFITNMCAFKTLFDAENQDNESKLEFCNGINDETVTHIHTHIHLQTNAVRSFVKLI